MAVNAPQIAYMPFEPPATHCSLRVAIRNEVLAIDRDQPVADIRSMSELSMRRWDGRG